MTLDDSLFPLVFVNAATEITERDVFALDAAFESVFALGRRFAIVTRSRIVRFPSAQVRARIAAWANRPSVHAATARFNVGHAYVVESPLVRGTMSAIFWIWDPPNPQYAAATFEDAVAWALERLVVSGTIDRAEAERLRSAALNRSA